jgi:hypothetical protein
MITHDHSPVRGTLPGPAVRGQTVACETCVHGGCVPSLALGIRANAALPTPSVSLVFPLIYLRSEESEEAS